MAKLIALMIVVVLVETIKTQPSCPKNAFYNTCTTKYKVSCVNVFIMNGQMDKKCHLHCECNKGLVFSDTSNSKCVELNQCNPSDVLCREGAAYSPNGYHQICGETIAQTFGAGCFCSEGLFYDKDERKCVEECPLVDDS